MGVLDRSFFMKLRNLCYVTDRKDGIKEKYLLIIILLIALSLRLYSIRFPYLMLNDEWMHYERARRLLEDGTYPAINYLDGLEGSNYYVAGYEGMYFLPVIVFKLISFTGVSFFRLFQILPVLLGVLSIIPLYLITKKHYDKKTALIGSAFFGVTIASTERSLAGYYRGDVFMLFFMLFMLYFFFNKKERLRNTLLDSFLSSLFLFLAGIMWVGWLFAFLVLSASFFFFSLFCFLTGKEYKGPLLSYALISLLGLGSLYIFKTLFFINFLDVSEKIISTQILEVQSFLLFSVTLCVIGAAMRLGFRSKMIWKIGLLVGLIFMFIIVEHYSSIFSTYSSQMYETHCYLNPENIDRTVSEQGGVSLEGLASHFGVLTLVFPLGLFYFITTITRKRILLLGWLLCSLLVMMLMLRFFFIASPLICLISAVGLHEIFPTNRKVSIPVICFLLAVNTFMTANFILQARPIMNEDWEETLTWIDGNMPKDAVILTWWNYPWLVEVWGKRKTLGGGSPSALNKEQYSFFVTDESLKGIQIAKKYSVTYLILDKEMWRYWNTMVEYAGFENLSPEKSFAYQLFMGEEIPDYKLVFHKNNIKIYQIDYSRKIHIATEKSAYLKSDTIEKSISVESGSKYLYGELEMMIYGPNKKIVYRNSEEISLSPHSQKTLPLHWTPTSDSKIGEYQISTYLYEKLPYSKRYLTFSYKKSSPSSYVGLYYMTNGYWHQIIEGSKTYYQGIPIVSQKDIEWHTMIVDVEKEMKGTNDDPLVSPYGRIESFELTLYGKPGDTAFFNSIKFYDDSGESIIFDGQPLGDVAGWGSDGFQGIVVDNNGRMNYTLIIQENNKLTADAWKINNKSFDFSLFALKGKRRVRCQSRII